MFLALGASPLNNLFDALKDHVSEIYSVGDCVKHRKMLEAVEAYDVARRIYSSSRYTARLISSLMLYLHSMHAFPIKPNRDWPIVRH